MTTFPNVPSGISSQLMFAPESTWGVFSGGTFRPLEFKNESLELKKTTVQGQGLHGGGLSGSLFDRLNRRVLTNYDVNGSITFDLPNRNLNALLQNMTGSPNYNGTNLAAPTQLTTSGAYQSYHSPANTQGLSLSFQKGVPTTPATLAATTITPFSYVGCKIVDWEISVETGAIVQCTLTIDGRNELAGAGNGDPLNGSVPGLQAFSESGVETATDPLNVFHFKQATLFSTGTPTLTTGVLSLTGATALGQVRSATMKETHTLDQARYFLGNQGFKSEQIENGFRQLTGTATIEFSGASAVYNAFAADTTLAMQLQFVGNVAGTAGSNHDTLVITMPNVKLNGESPKVGGPGIVTQSVSWTGLDDESTLPYQIQYISTDSAV